MTDEELRVIRWRYDNRHSGQTGALVFMEHADANMGALLNEIVRLKEALQAVVDVTDSGIPPSERCWAMRSIADEALASVQP